MSVADNHPKTFDMADHPTFAAAAEAFKALNVPFWLDQGTLLGLVRDGKLLETDHDIDLGVWAEDYKKVKPEFLRELKLEEAWLETYKPHQLTISSLTGEAKMINIAFYRRSSGNARKKVYYPHSSLIADLLIRIAVFSAHAAAGTLGIKLTRSSRLHLAILFAAKLIPAPFWRIFGHLAGRSQYFFKPYVIMAVPEEFFMNLEQISVNSLKLPVPSNPEAYLELKYGPDWRKPRQDWIFWKDDGAVIGRTKG